MTFEKTPETAATMPLMKVHRERILLSSLSDTPRSCADEMSQASKQEKRMDCGVPDVSAILSQHREELQNTEYKD